MKVYGYKIVVMHVNSIFLKKKTKSKVKVSLRKGQKQKTGGERTLEGEFRI